MRRAIAIILLSIHLLANTEIREFAKLEAFVSHFMEHKTADDRLTLLEFVNIHYLQHNAPDADHEEDMKLPFKAHDCSTHASVTTILCFTTFRIYSPHRYVPDAKRPSEQNAIPLSRISDIWHPPKSC